MILHRPLWEDLDVKSCGGTGPCEKILKMLCMVLYRALKEGYSGDPGGTLSNKQVLA